MVCPFEEGDSFAGGIVCPIMCGTDAHPMCRIMAAGFLWFWFMTPNAYGHPFLDARVKREGTMHIIKGTPQLTERIKKELVELNLTTYKAPNAHKLDDWGFE